MHGLDVFHRQAATIGPLSPLLCLSCTSLVDHLDSAHSMSGFTPASDDKRGCCVVLLARAPSWVPQYANMYTREHTPALSRIQFGILCLLLVLPYGRDKW